MQGRSAVRLLAAFALVAWLATLSTPCARADAVNVTLTGPAAITIPEDGIVHDFTYTLTNNSGGTINFSSISLISGLVSGDSSDSFPSVSWNAFGGSCGSSLANTASCTLIFSITPDSGTGETDADFGSQPFTLGWGFSTALVTDSVSVNPTVTITDPGFVATPEPSSLILLCTGLLGVLGAARRKWLG